MLQCLGFSKYTLILKELDLYVILTKTQMCLIFLYNNELSDKNGVLPGSANQTFGYLCYFASLYQSRNCQQIRRLDS